MQRIGHHSALHEVRGATQRDQRPLLTLAASLASALTSASSHLQVPLLVHLAQNVKVAEDQQTALLATQHNIKAILVNGKTRADFFGGSKNDHRDSSLAALKRVDGGSSGHAQKGRRILQVLSTALKKLDISLVRRNNAYARGGDVSFFNQVREKLKSAIDLLLVSLGLSDWVNQADSTRAVDKYLPQSIRPC